MCLESKRVEWDEGRNAEEMGEQVKRTIVDNARKACGSVRVGGNKPKDYMVE